MIQLKQTKPILKPVKEETPPPKSNIPFQTMDSTEVDFIRQKIEANKAYLSKCTNQGQYRKVEKDTLFMENQILPVLLSKTNLFYNELTKKFIHYLDCAIQNKCNSLVVYLPIDDNYMGNPKAGIANCRQNKEFGSMGAVDINLELINMDGNEALFTTILLDNI